MIEIISFQIKIYINLLLSNHSKNIYELLNMNNQNLSKEITSLYDEIFDLKKQKNNKNDEIKKSEDISYNKNNSKKHNELFNNGIENYHINDKILKEMEMMEEPKPQIFSKLSSSYINKNKNWLNNNEIKNEKDQIKVIKKIFNKNKNKKELKINENINDSSINNSCTFLITDSNLSSLKEEKNNLNFDNSINLDNSIENNEKNDCKIKEEMSFNNNITNLMQKKKIKLKDLDIKQKFKKLDNNNRMKQNISSKYIINFSLNNYLIPCRSPYGEELFLIKSENILINKSQKEILENYLNKYYLREKSNGSFDSSHNLKNILFKNFQNKNNYIYKNKIQNKIKKNLNFSDEINILPLSNSYSNGKNLFNILPSSLHIPFDIILKKIEQEKYKNDTIIKDAEINNKLSLSSLTSLNRRNFNDKNYKKINHLHKTTIDYKNSELQNLKKNSYKKKIIKDDL